MVERYRNQEPLDRRVRGEDGSMFSHPSRLPQCESADYGSTTTTVAVPLAPLPGTVTRIVTGPR